MNQYETGKHMPDPLMVSALCKVMDAPISYMFCDDDQLAEIITCYFKLTPAHKKELLHTANIYLAHQVQAR